MKLYNSLTQSLEVFKPLNPHKVTIYVCGITPYDTTHLGHAFTYVFFDVLQRYLKFKGYKIKYVQNVTDIDDDILKKAREVGQDWRKLGDFWTKKFLDDMAALNVEPPSHYVRATDSIDKMIQIIEVLIKKDLAYQKDGEIYFEIKKFKRYGKLSRCSKDQMMLLSEERGGNPADPQKKDPLDFILWQRSQPEEPSWDSPWGKGRPGWHIECSAMIHEYLGEQIDIHGGGRDLMYPHHESEIAQSESFTGKSPFVKLWIHVCMLLYQGEKMAKSLGNLVMVKDLLKRYSPNTIRFLLLSHHYRAPWEFTQDNLRQIQKKVKFIEQVTASKEANTTAKEQYIKQFQTIMDQDLDTPKALQFLLELANEKRPELKTLYKILGFRLEK